jgi:hypothetical protein
LDLNDNNWEKYFFKEELGEINDAMKNLQNQEIPEKIENLLSSIPKTTAIKSIFNHLNHCIIDPFESKDLYWFKKSLQDAAYLFITGYYPITDELERDLVRRVCSFVGEFFDSSELYFKR